MTTCDCCGGTEFIDYGTYPPPKEPDLDGGSLVELIQYQADQQTGGTNGHYWKCASCKCAGFDAVPDNLALEVLEELPPHAYFVGGVRRVRVLGEKK